MTPVFSPRFRVEPEPARGNRAGDVVGFDLGDVAPELLEGLADLALEARLDRLFEVGIALAHDLVHDGGLHARGLELREGFSRIDGIELLGVAHQHDARDADFVGDPQEVAGLHGGRQRPSPRNGRPSRPCARATGAAALRCGAGRSRGTLIRDRSRPGRRTR